MLRIVAVLAIRNEQAYLANCLKQLIRDDIKFAIVDNGSTDATAAILHEDRFAPWLAEYRYLPFEGVLDRERLLIEQHELTRTLDADWIVHLDADEIIHPYGQGESLRAGLSRLDAEGWDVINCDEFVFLPVDHHYEPDCEGMPLLHYYYFFEPEPLRLMRVWRKAADLSNVQSGGHKLGGSQFRLAPKSFVLRHYIFQDQHHAYTKYASRLFAEAALARGWHGNRYNQPVARFAFPAPASLHCLQFPEARDFRKDDPRTKHYWQW